MIDHTPFDTILKFEEQRCPESLTTALHSRGDSQLTGGSLPCISPFGSHCKNIHSMTMASSKILTSWNYLPRTLVYYTSPPNLPKGKISSCNVIF